MRILGVGDDTSQRARKLMTGGWLCELLRAQSAILRGGECAAVGQLTIESPTAKPHAKSQAEPRRLARQARVARDLPRYRYGPHWSWHRFSKFRAAGSALRAGPGVSPVPACSTGCAAGGRRRQMILQPVKLDVARRSADLVHGVPAFRAGPCRGLRRWVGLGGLCRRPVRERQRQERDRRGAIRRCRVVV